MVCRLDTLAAKRAVLRNIFEVEELGRTVYSWPQRV